MMKAELATALTPITLQRRGGLFHRLVKRAVIRRLEALDYGTLMLIDGADRRRFGRRRTGEPQLTLTILDPAAWTAVAFGGGLGGGEAYMAGQWRCDDLTGLVRLLLRNPQPRVLASNHARNPDEPAQGCVGSFLFIRYNLF